jgi:predicted RNase H-like HicB family nuclease
VELVAECERHEGWWIVTVPAVRGLHTQARRLDQVEAMVKDAASLLLDRPEGDFAVVVTPKLPADERHEIDQVRAARTRLAEAEQTMARTSRSAVADLRAQGFTVRDVAALIGVTPSRVSQLA